MLAKAVDLAVGLDGKQRITFQVEGDARAFFQSHRDKPVELTAKRPRKKRSLDANAMMWTFCKKIADATGVTKEDVYRKNIREVGEYTPLPIREDAIDRFSQIWAGHGIGWFIEVVDDSKLKGYKLVFAYHGSSTYDTKEMSRLIDSVLQDAEAIGIDTMSESERSLLIDAWSPR